VTPDHTHGLCSLLIGDCRTRLADIPDNSIHCCITSPPYWGLRDYGHGEQIGLETTPEAYVAEMVAVFREVRRVLREDGTCWLNLGDSYAATTKGSGGPDSSSTLVGTKAEHNGQSMTPRKMSLGNLKPKDLVGIPWRVAFALQADGWWLRQDIIWSKPNPMPESVTDRCTKAHEYVFLLTKSARYFYDAEAVKEAFVDERQGKSGAYKRRMESVNPYGRQNAEMPVSETGRNRRSVWTVATKPYSGAHFATFPPALITPCILAGTSAKGCCGKCGAPWERVVERDTIWRVRPHSFVKRNGTSGTGNSIDQKKAGVASTTTGWQPTCDCNADITPCIVLDPFNGSGTTGIVSRDHGRRYIGCELNPEYAELTKRRWAGLEPEEPEDDPQELTGPRQGRLMFGDDE